MVIVVTIVNVVVVSLSHCCSLIADAVDDNDIANVLLRKVYGASWKFVVAFTLALDAFFARMCWH